MRASEGSLRPLEDRSHAVVILCTYRLVWPAALVSLDCLIDRPIEDEHQAAIELEHALDVDGAFPDAVLAGEEPDVLTQEGQRTD